MVICVEIKEVLAEEQNSFCCFAAEANWLSINLNQYLLNPISNHSAITIYFEVAHESIKFT
jgi:hypothetical protein